MATAKKKARAVRSGRIGDERPSESVPAFVALEREARASGELDDPMRTDRIAGAGPAEFGRRLLAPNRPREAAVRAALEGVTEPDEAWEILAAREVVPVEWTSAGARQVVVDKVACELCADRVAFMGHAEGCERANVPATVTAAATLAADPEGVVAAETLARLAFERLYGETAARPPQVLWRVGALFGCFPVADRRPGKSRAKSAKPGAWETAKVFTDALSVRGEYEVPPGYVRYGSNMIVASNIPEPYRATWARPGFQVVNSPWVSAFAADAVNHWSWALSVREKRPNPFTPLCEVWLLGYAVDHIDEDMIVLFAPTLTLRDP
jgi:hypothetical protein